MSAAPGSFHIDPNALYSLDGLRDGLSGIVELPTLLDRLGLREQRVFRDAVWGWELIEAARRSSSYGYASAGKARHDPQLPPGAAPLVKARPSANASVRRLKLSDLK